MEDTRHKALSMLEARFPQEMPLPPECPKCSCAERWYSRAVESAIATEARGRLPEYAQGILLAIEASHRGNALYVAPEVLVYHHGDDKSTNDTDSCSKDSDSEDDDGSVMVRCKCGGRAEWSQRQTRSADEAMTTFATCTKCHRTWRF